MRTIAVDIELIFGVDVSPTVDEVKTGLESVLGQLEPVKIKFSGNFEDIKHEADELRKTLGEGGKGIQLVDASNFDSLNKIVDQLTEIVSLVREINSKQFTITASFGGNKTDVEELRLYKQEAEALARTVDGMAGALHKMDGRTLSSALDANLSRRLVNLNEEYKHLPTYLGNIDSATTVSGVRKIIAVLGEYKRVYDEVFARANIPMPTEALDRTTAELEEYLKRRKEAAANLKDALTPSGAPTTDASTAAATDSLDKFKTLSVDIGDVLKGIRTQIEETFDLSTINLHTEDLKKQLQEIVDLVKQIPSTPNNTPSNQGNNPTGNPGGSPGAGDVQQAERTVQAYDELVRKSKQVYESGREVETETRRQATANSILTGTIKTVTNAQGEQSQNVKITEDTAAATRQANGAQELYNRAVFNAEDALKRYARAQTSNKAINREAYEGISEQREELERLWKDYQNDRDFQKFKSGVNAVDRAVKSHTKTLNENGERVNTLGDKLKGVVGHYISLQRVVGLVVRSMREMIQASMDMDKALTQMQIVTGRTDSEMKQFASDAFAAADRVGANVSDVISGATTYARLGFSSEVSTQLAELTTMLQNVGDIQTQDAQDAITAILMAFEDIDEKNIERKLDEIVAVGNNFPISVSQIAEGMNNGASMYAAANNNFEQSVALLTAANATVQNAAKASTGLRTIAARIRKSKTELDELGEAMAESEYEDLVKAFTDAHVALTDINGDYRSTYDIFKDLSEVWGTLGDDVRSALASTMGSTRNQNIFYSLVQNFGLAEDAIGKMSEAEGELADKNRLFVESIEGFVARFKNEFTELATEIFSSDWIKDAVSMAKTVLVWVTKIAEALVNVINALGGIKVILPVIGTLIVGLKITSVARAAAALVETGQEITTMQRLAMIAAGKTAAANLGLAASFKAVAAGILEAAAAWITSPIGIITTTVGLAAVSINSYVKKQEAAINAIKKANEDADEAYKKAKQTTQDHQSEVDALNQKLEETRDRIKELEGLPKLSLTDQEELDNLNEINLQLEAQLALKKEIAEYDARQEAKSFSDKMRTRYDAVGTPVTQDNRYSGTERNTERTWGDEDLAKLFGEFAQAVKANAANNGQGYVDVLSGQYVTPESAKVTLLDFLEALPGLTTDSDILYDAIKHIEDDLGGIVYNTHAQTDEAKAQNEWVRRLQNAQLRLYRAAGADNGYRNTIGSLLGRYGLGVQDFRDYGKMGTGNDDNMRAFLEDIKELVGAEFFLPDGLTLDQIVADGFNEDDYIVKGLIDILDSDAAKRAAANGDNLSESTDNIQTALSKITAASAGLDILEKIRGDVSDGGTFDYSSLVDDKFKEEFGDLGGAYDDFIETVANSPNDIEACQAAFDRLTQAYLLQRKYLGGVNDNTKEVIISFLEEKGVANAAALVNEALNGSFTDTEDTLVSYSGTVDDTTQKLSGLQKTISDLNSLSSGFDILGKIYADVANGESFDFASLIDTSFVEKFRELGPAYDEFIETVAKTPDNIDACQEAFNKLTIEYIKQSKVLDGVTEDNKDVVIAMLKEMGVANASAVVNDALAVSYAKIEIAKMAANRETITTADDVANLIGLATQAHQTAEAITQLEEVMGWMNIASKALENKNLEMYNHAMKSANEILDNWFRSTYNPEVDITTGIDLSDLWVGIEDAADSAADTVNSSTEKIKTWFEEQYAEHKHLVAMEKETDYEYYTWLEGAMKKAYAEGILSQEDYWKYEEEVYNGMKKLRENAEKEAQSNFDKLVDIRKKMLEKEVSDQKDALNDELKNLKDFYDKQRKMLQDSYDEEDYLEEQAEKRKSVSDLEEELARLRYDDSAWAQKRRAEISQQIADARKDLNDFERDHARDEALSFLDEQEEAAEAKINSKLDALEEKAKSAKELNDQAIEDVKNGTAELYREMIEWNAEYGDGLTETVTAAWNGLYQAASDYKQLVGTIFNGVKIANVTGYKLQPVGKGYASGTSYAAPGLHPIDEQGSETYFSPSTGGKYKMFSGGEKVLTAKASDFLYRFANGGSEMLKKFIASVGGGVLNDRLTPLMTNNEIVMGDIVVQGNADRATVSEIRRAQRESVEFMLKEFGKLNR